MENKVYSEILQAIEELGLHNEEKDHSSFTKSKFKKAKKDENISFELTNS